MAIPRAPRRRLPPIHVPGAPQGGRMGSGRLLVLLMCVTLLAMCNRDPVSLKHPETPQRTWQKTKTLPLPPEQVSAYGLAFSPDSRLLACVLGTTKTAVPNT